MSQAGSEEAASNLELRHGTVARRLTDRVRPSTTPSYKKVAQQQHSSKSAAAAPQPQPQRQQEQRRGRERGWRWGWPRQMSYGTAAWPGLIIRIITTTNEHPGFSSFLETNAGDPKRSGSTTAAAQQHQQQQKQQQLYRRRRPCYVGGGGGGGFGDSVVG